MTINIRDDKKIVDIWLTNEEKKNQELRELLKPLYAEYKASGFLVVVFESGDDDLWDNISQLLCSNRYRLAALEIELEKQMNNSQ